MEIVIRRLDEKEDLFGCYVENGAYRYKIERIKYRVHLTYRLCNQMTGEEILRVRYRQLVIIPGFRATVRQKGVLFDATDSLIHGYNLRKTNLTADIGGEQYLELFADGQKLGGLDYALGNAQDKFRIQVLDPAGEYPLLALSMGVMICNMVKRE